MFKEGYRNTGVYSKENSQCGKEMRNQVMIQFWVLNFEGYQPVGAFSSLLCLGRLLMSFKP